LVSIRNSSILKLVVLLLIGCSLLTPVTQPTDSTDDMSEIIPPVHPSQDPVVKTWHHDCSNTTGFEYMEIPIFSERWWKYINVSMESDGQSFTMPSISNTSTDDYYYGPMYVYTLPEAFPLSGLKNFSVHMELNNSDSEYRGIVRVGLISESHDQVLMAYIDENSGFETQAGCRWKYYLRNWSIHTDVREDQRPWFYELGYANHMMEYANMTWMSWYDQEHGLNGSIPAWDPQPATNRTILPAEEAETARDIKYIVIMFGGYYRYRFYPLPPFRVHDIYLEYELGDVIDTFPPLLTPQLDMVYIVGQTGNTIEWRCTDDNPYRYWLLDYKYTYNFDGLNRKEGLWNGTDYTVSVDGLPVGNRTFLLVLQDKAGFMVMDKVTVMVIEHPFISFLKMNAMVIGLASFVSLVCIICYWDDRRTSRSTKKPVPAQAAP